MNSTATASLTSKSLPALAAQWSPEKRAAMIDYLSSDAKRKVLLDAYKDVSELAETLDPNYNVTPALKLIGHDIEQVITEPRHNLMITMPPQEGKSTMGSVYTPLRALMLNPNCRIILATHGDSLAEEHSAMCRSLINQHGSGVVDPITGVEVEDKLGFRLARGQERVKSWKVAGAKGGMLAVGWGSSITGRPADLFIIDDLIKNMMEADSANHRRKIAEWFASVATTRLSPDASMIVIQTRWHPDDLAGQILAGQLAQHPRFRTWRHINIPAISEPPGKGIRDALDREPGVVMVSARGRTKKEFEQTRRTVGERFWYAMYQGAPQPPEGGLFQRKWFENHADAPMSPVATIIGLDPADTGEDDDTGIIAASLDTYGRVVFTEDWSGKFTSDQWGQRTVRLALTIGAREIAMEAYTTATTYEAVIKRAYRAIHLDAVTKQAAGAELTPLEMRALSEMPPFVIYKWRAGARIDAIGRSSLLRQALETGRASTVEDKMDALIEDACTWQVGQHQPDRVAAAVITHDRLAGMIAGQATMAPPIDRRPQNPLEKMMANPNQVVTPLARKLGRR